MAEGKVSHSRSRSFFSNGGGGSLLGGSSATAAGSNKTYGKKRSKGHKSSLTQTHIDQQLWNRPETVSKPMSATRSFSTGQSSTSTASSIEIDDSASANTPPPPSQPSSQLRQGLAAPAPAPQDDFSTTQPTTLLNVHSRSRTASSVSRQDLVGLGVLDFESGKENDLSSWETETTEVLKEVSQPRPLSSASSFSINTIESSASSKSRPLSRVARVLSTLSISSNSTIEGNGAHSSRAFEQSKHTSLASSIATINRAPGVGVVTVGESFRNSADDLPSNLQIRRNASNGNGQQQQMLSLLVESPRPPTTGGDTPRLESTQPPKSAAPTTETSAHGDRDDVVRALDIPRMPAADPSHSPVLTPTSTSSVKSRETNQSRSIVPSPSVSSFLSFKKGGSELKHKRVNKTAISGPTSMADSTEYFADTASVASTNASTKSRRRRSRHKNGSSLLSSISSSSMFFSQAASQPRDREPMAPGGTLPTPSGYLGQLPTKRSSFADIKRSIMSFSASSTNLFRHASSSPKANVQGHPADKPMISLPTPVDTSRDKLRNKLRASNSLMSIARVDTSDSLVAVPMEQHLQTQLDTLLGLCNSSAICDFSEYIGEITDRAELKKLAEASFSEVYVQRDRVTNTSQVYKVIPFGNEELELLPIQDIIQELSIARLLMSLEGFVDVIDAAVVRGPYPGHLLQQWDEYNEEHGSENYRPDYFPEDQLYCVLVMSNAGTDLEHFSLSSWLEAETIFWQAAYYLAIAEKKYRFEHRDLHWGNLVISTQRSGAKCGDGNVGSVSGLLKKMNLNDLESSTRETRQELETATVAQEDLGDDLEYDYDHKDLKVTLIDYTLSRATNIDGTVIYTRLDHPDFFRGKGDYQFDIYRYMRAQISNMAMAPGLPSAGANGVGRQNSPLLQGANYPGSAGTDIDWSIFCGKTNVMWLHYICDKLFNGKGLGKVVSTRSGRLSSGGSNGSLHGARNGGGYSEATDEARACKSLETVHRTIDPRKKVFASKKASTGQASFADFTSARNFVLWSMENNIVPRDLQATFTAI